MPSSDTPSASLTERLVAAAAAAVAAQHRDLERDPGSLKGVVVELSVSTRGQIVECDAFLQRRVRVDTILGLPHGGPVR